MFKIKEKNNIKYLEFERAREYGFKVLFTTRIGGVSKDPYQSLNLGYHTEDNIENIRTNRNRLYDSLKLNDKEMIYGEQIHDDKFKLVKDEDKQKGVNADSSAIKGVDGLISKDNNIILAGNFADCLSIYLIDKNKRYFSLSHAGWKGTYNKILSKVIGFFTDNLNCRLEDLIVVIGPSISQNNYEIDYKLAIKFIKKFKFKSSYYIKKDGSYFLDLKGLNKLIALDKGIDESNLFISKFCTYQREDLFYSYRRDKKTGRMNAFILRHI